MFSFTLIEVAIGLVFMYLLLSLICSALTELVASALKLRAEFLKAGIRNLLEYKQAPHWTRDFFNHALIKGLSQHDPVSEDFRSASYLPAELFARVLLDLVRPEPIAAANPGLAVLAERPPTAGDPVRDAVNTLISQAGDDAARASEQIQNWYDAAMERVSGWYKRWTQLISLVLGLFIAIWMNADTVAVARSLWTDPALRAATVAAADRYVREAPAAAAAPGAAAAPRPPAVPAGTAADDPMARLLKTQESLLSLKLPLGWDAPSAFVRYPSGAADWTQTFGHHLAGWLLTAVALSLGAPFWFDRLKDLMRIRSAGQNPSEPKK